MIFRVGRVKRGGAQGPGIFFVIPCIDAMAVCDLRVVSFDVPPQEILTKDSVTVYVDAVVYYKIEVNPEKSNLNTFELSKNYSLLTRILCQLCATLLITLIVPRF